MAFLNERRVSQRFLHEHAICKLKKKMNTALPLKRDCGIIQLVHLHQVKEPSFDLVKVKGETSNFWKRNLTGGLYTGTGRGGNRFTSFS